MSPTPDDADAITPEEVAALDVEPVMVEPDFGFYEEGAPDADLAALDRLSRSARVGRTTMQAGIGAAVVTVFEFTAAYLDLDLDPREPGVQDTFPPTFTAAMFVIVSAIAAAVMNRRPKA